MKKLQLLEVENLDVWIQEKHVIKGLDLRVTRGEIVVITGPNGSGKSSLAQALMGSTQYTTHSTQMLFEGISFAEMSIDERARMGLYVAWQNPVAIPGVSIFALCKAIVEARGVVIDKLVEFKNKLEALASEVGLSAEYISRDINDGFSGGEKKRLELLQVLLFRPKVVILDEIDSGLDKVGRELVVMIVNRLKKEGVAFVVITHYEQLIKQLGVDRVLEMRNGQLYPRV